MTPPSSTRSRALVFVLVVIACGVGIAGYARHAAQQAQVPAAAASTTAITPVPSAPPASQAATTASATSAAAIASAANAAPVVPTASVASTPPRVAAAHAASAARPFLLFRSTALGDGYGRVTQAWLDDPEGPRSVTPISCDRVHYAAGSGVCLTAERGALTVYRAVLFDARFAIRKTITLAGPPSRARVSADGRKVAFTVFVNGHAYSMPSFTTRTTIVDALTGASLVDDLEAWPVTRDGAAFKATDFNFWGVTFTQDAAHFYATLGTGGKTWLVEGEFATRQMHVVAEDVECPSLSPDGRRIAFKRRDTTNPGGRFYWHVAVLDLASGQVRVLPGESRSVDDQVEWNGNAEILYAMPLDSQQSSAETDVWAIAADGATPARRLARFAFSPAVVR
jgi:hypothetical protein